MNKITILADQPELKQQAKNEYKFQKELTDELDLHGDQEFTGETMLKIVLWKLNRYPLFDDDLLRDINTLRQDCSEEKARLLLDKLLGVKGIDLPMASTILRFAYPDQFQIIDQRVYRFITPDADVLKLPRKKSEKINFYFDYLKSLRENCLVHGIDFRKADRILYQLDKITNRTIPIKY